MGTEAEIQKWENASSLGGRCRRGGEGKAGTTEGLKWHDTILQVSLLSGTGGHLSCCGHPSPLGHFSYA